MMKSVAHTPNQAFPDLSILGQHSFISNLTMSNWSHSQSDNKQQQSNSEQDSSNLTYRLTPGSQIQLQTPSLIVSEETSSADSRARMFTNRRAWLRKVDGAIDANKRFLERFQRCSNAIINVGNCSEPG